MHGSPGRGLERNGHVAAASELREVVTTAGESVVLYRGVLGPHEFVTHVHAEFTIGVVDAGAQLFTAAGRVHEAGPGDVVVIGPEVPHDGRPGGRAGFAHRSFYVAPALAARLLDSSDALRDDTRVLGRSPLAARLGAVHAAVCEGGVAPELWEPILADCLAAVLARHRAPRPSQAAALTRPPGNVFSRPASGPVSAQARAAGISTRHLRRLCRAATGLPPHRFAMQQRLRQARTLLVAGVPPAVVAAELGFADQAHFTRAFRQTYGVTPARVHGPRQPA